MSLTHAEVIDRYRKGADHATGSRMFSEGDVLYSYGKHFPMVVRLNRGGYIVNGDRYSSTTTQHQNQVFDFGPQVPFTALAAAGISGIPELQELAVVDAASDHREFICRCGGDHSGSPYSSYKDNGVWRLYQEYTAQEDSDHFVECHDGYMQHVLGGTLVRHHRRYLLSGIDDTGVRGGVYFMCQLPRKVVTMEEAYESLIPAPVKLARAFGAEIQRQGDFFFVKSSLETRALNVNGYQKVSASGRRWWDAPLTEGYPLDVRNSHLAAEMRELTGVRYVRGTVRHAPREHQMVRLGKDWWSAHQNTARASWAAAGYVD